MKNDSCTQTRRRHWSILSAGNVTGALRWLGFISLFMWTSLSLSQTLATATTTATVGQVCAASRFGQNLNCTSNDFSVGINFTQPSQNAIANCVAGQYIDISLQADITSNSPDRYDVALFVGENGNDPALQVAGAANTCSLGVAPATPGPFANLNAAGSQCGDFIGGGTASWVLTNIRVLCQPVPGTNQLAIPHTLVWTQSSVNTCTPGNVTAGTTAKCTGSVLSGVTGVAVQGYVVITKQSNPGDSTQSFSFTASSPGTTALTPTSFNLSNGQSQTVLINLSGAGGTQNLVITETAQPGWSTTASISCTRLDDSAASYVTTSSVNRQITATLSPTNFAAKCTITNTRLPRVRLFKAVEPLGAPGVFNLSVRSDLGTTTAANQGSGGSTSYQVTNPGPVTLTETAGSATTLTEYISAINCVNESTSASVTITMSTLTGATRTAVLTPPNLVDTRCTFTNTRAANLSLSKTNGTDTLIAGSSTTYTIVVNNNGPAPVDGAILRDPVVTGLSCTSIACTGSTGGAICPISPNISALQGSGIFINALPASSSLTFSIQCGVTATGF